MPVLSSAPPPLPGPPVPPRFDRWPVTLRSAARLQGIVVPCGPGLRGAAWPETPSVRAAALAEYLDGGRIATHLTAAWVWGTARDPGPLIRVSVAGHQRGYRPGTGRVRVYELRWAPGDIHRLGEFAVTAPRRTVLDLLYGDADFGRPERIACRLLLSGLAEGRDGIARHLREHRRPHRRTATARLAEL